MVQIIRMYVIDTHILIPNRPFVMNKNHGLALGNTVFDYDLWNESSLKSKCKEVLDNGFSWERLCQKVYVYYHLQKE